MRITRSFEFQIGSKEEKLPYIDPSFPYIASRAELDFYCEPFTFGPVITCAADTLSDNGS